MRGDLLWEPPASVHETSHLAAYERWLRETRGLEFASYADLWAWSVADVPADGRRVLLRVRVRRMRCPVPDCKVQTFREQVPGVLDRYQRRTTRLTAQVSAVARELAGRAGARLLPALGILVSRHTALRALLRIPQIGERL